MIKDKGITHIAPQAATAAALLHNRQSRRTAYRP